MKFYKDNNTILEAINGDSTLNEVVVRSVDASVEKHVPQIKVERNIVTVTVGSVTHPMADKHYIEFIAIETTQGVHRKNLKPGMEPKAVFALCDEELVGAYAYCNLHGMWDNK
jgi:superoxide reductase